MQVLKKSLSLPFWTTGPLKDRIDRLSWNMVENYHSRPCKIPKERRSHLHLGGSLKSRTIFLRFNFIPSLVREKSLKNNILKYGCNYMNHTIKHSRDIYFAHTFHLCVPYHSWNKHRLFLNNNKWLDCCNATSRVLWQELFQCRVLVSKIVETVSHVLAKPP
jgi:hypothetical protein